MKMCTKCNLNKCKSKFSLRKVSKDGLHSWCKQCYLDRWLDPIYKSKANHARRLRDIKNPLKLRAERLKKYGITLEQYNDMLENQNGLCKICNKSEVARDGRFKKLKSLSVDHCHKTGKIRGLLCDSCNRGLGFLRDSIDILRSATEYLYNSNIQHFSENKGV